MTALDTLLRQVADVAVQHAQHSAFTQAQAVTACRQLEGALVVALGGTPLRGLKNLGHGPLTCYGSRVRNAPGSRRASWKLLWDLPTLILDHTGHLVIAHWHAVPGEEDDVLDTRPARDDEIFTTDVAALVRALEDALPKHLTEAIKRGERFQQTADLAVRIGRLAEGA